MAAMTSFYATKCCYLVRAGACASASKSVPDLY